METPLRALTSLQEVARTLRQARVRAESLGVVVLRLRAGGGFEVRLSELLAPDAGADSGAPLIRPAAGRR
jgi:hypothetical protein